MLKYVNATCAVGFEKFYRSMVEVNTYNEDSCSQMSAPGCEDVNLETCR